MAFSASRRGDAMVSLQFEQRAPGPSRSVMKPADSCIWPEEGQLAFEPGVGFTRRTMSRYRRGVS